MRLSTVDLERLRVADIPDFGYELALGGAQLADRTGEWTGGQRLAEWRLDVARGWNRSHGRLFDLYTQMYIPAFFGQVATATPAGIDPQSPAATAHLRDLARSGVLTPFTRGLADARPGAVGTLNAILTDFRARALDPYRRRITSIVATTSATATVRAALGGTDAMLSSLHPSIHWDGRELRLNTILDAEESLQGRPLIFQPTALATRIMFDPLADSVSVIYPATAGPVTSDPHLDAAPRSLVSLLGATRAAALVTVVTTPSVTTGLLAAALGVSIAAASRHATVLRDTGLIATIRNGQTVHHTPTRLGIDLAHGTTTTTNQRPGAISQTAGARITELG
jgi:DNA-binding transcriptional ArsR family regulator